MKLSHFLKDKIVTIALLLFGIITIEIILLTYQEVKLLQIYIPITILGLYILSLVIEYYRKNQYYRRMNQTLDGLNEKYLMAEMLQKPNFSEAEILKDVLEQTNQSMLEKVNQYKHAQEEYKEYIEMWIHEIKTPISASKMIIENNKTQATKRINEELDKVENYIEQALFYARSNTVEKDYYIKKTKVSDIVNEVIRKNKAMFIGEKIGIQLHSMDIAVYTDSKWMVFMLNQVIQNSIKYRNKEKQSKIEIDTKQGKENVVLIVKDNGMGIEKGELGRVFEKGFTGTNGRNLNKKSTGIGLYLCKKLCDKLGMGIEISSIPKQQTEVKFIFPHNSYIEMNENLTKM